MKRLLFYLLCASLAVPTVGCVTARTQAERSSDRVVTLEEARYGLIDLACAEAGWTTLRKITEPPGGVQLRVWFDYGLGGITGFALSRTEAGSTGEKVAVLGTVKVEQVQPKSGWAAFWAQYFALGDIAQVKRLPWNSYSHAFDNGEVGIEWLSAGAYQFMSFDNDEADAQPEHVGVSAFRSLFRRELM